MGTYDRILTQGDTFPCEGCIGYNSAKGKCDGWKPQLNKKEITCNMHNNNYYANADQIQALIKEAESGAHKWVRENTLFVCDSKKDHTCLACSYRQPTLLYPLKTDCFEGIIIPYRGSKTEEKTWPGRKGKTHSDAISELIEKGTITSQLKNGTDEDCSEVEKVVVSKMEITEKGDSDDIGDVEYKVIRHISLETMALSKHIGHKGFRCMFKYGNISRQVGNVIDSEDYLYKHILALMAGGFIEEKVSDPVVHCGDTFKTCDNVYILMHINDGFFQLNCIYDGCSYDSRMINRSGARLSAFVGKDRLKEFKPVTVEITVVED